MYTYKCIYIYVITLAIITTVILMMFRTIQLAQTVFLLRPEFAMPVEVLPRRQWSVANWLTMIKHWVGTN